MTYTLQIVLPEERRLSLVSLDKMTNQEFEDFCFANPEIVAELEPDGTFTIMSPVSPISGNRENEIATDLNFYARKQGGKSFSSSTGFTLPDGSVRSPDASYVSQEQIDKLTEEDLRHFAEIVPEFIVEIVSPTDRLKDVEKKMRDSWIENGVLLAWLIDVDADKLWVYRADRSVELISPLDRVITGEDVLPGFTFDLTLLT